MLTVRGKSIYVIPVLEGRATNKLLHYHCTIGGFPAHLNDEDILAKIKGAWHLTSFGNDQVDVQQFKSAKWLDYMSKELGFEEADGIDWENVHLPTL